MNKSISLSDTDVAILKSKYKKTYTHQAIAIAVTILFYVSVIYSSSISQSSSQFWVFTCFSLIFLFIVSIIINRNRNNYAKDLQEGIKVIVEGKISSIYTKYNSDNYGSFVLNGKRYFAYGDHFRKLQSGILISVEVAPNSRLVMSIR